VELLVQKAWSGEEPHWDYKLMQSSSSGVSAS
jgi:hypothetical protein